MRLVEADAATLFDELTAALTGPGDLEEILARAANALADGLQADLAQVWTLDESSTVLELRATAGAWPPRDPAHARIPVANSWVGATIREQRTRTGRLSDLNPDRSSPDLATEHGTAEVFSQPLALDGRAIGALVLFWRRPGASASSGAGVTAAGRLVALALDRHRLNTAGQRFREILDATPDFVTIVRADGSPLYINPAARRALGLGAAEPVESMLEFRPPGFGTYLRERILPTAARDGAWRGETDYVTRDGDVIHVSQVSVVHYDPGGEMKCVSTISRDITAEAARNKEARRAEERTRFALEAARAGVWETDLRSGQVIWSETMRAVQGFDAEEFGGTFDSFRALIHPADRDAMDKAMRENIEAGPGDYKMKFRTLWPDGTTHWVEAYARIVADASGRPARVLGMAQDVTQRESLEEQLRQAQKMEAVGQLAGGVAHDFNNLLTVILGYSTLLGEQLAPGDPHREEIDEIHRAATSAANLTRQLLAFSRRQILQPTLIAVNELVTESGRMLGRLVGEHIELVLQLQPGLALVKADASQLEQILVNLAINARDAMPKGGTLTIRTANEEFDEAAARRESLPAAGRYVSIAVRDTGIGMSDATMSRIFEPFFTTKEKGKGTGLGLATVFGIVAQSGGAVSVQSAPGRGTEFKVRLPAVASARPAPGAPANGPAVRGGSETVLLVEDDDKVRALAKLALQRLGYRVIAASTPSEAVAIADSMRDDIQLVVTDVVMPGLSGPALFERLKAARPALRVLFISGFAHDAVADHGILDASVPFLPKPFAGSDLARKVREVLDRSETL